jgi:hypothetical protein
MDRYIIESPHSAHDCKHVMEQVINMGYITHYDWGCESGIHTGWVIIEAENEEEALLSVPVFIRHDAQVVRLNKFSPEKFEKMHSPNRNKT